MFVCGICSYLAYAARIGSPNPFAMLVNLSNKDVYPDVSKENRYDFNIAISR